eukprot:TRINITY_DN599_c0_g1_i3.p1 TRINITY_DN599_c0_g1~~TRINITY_DN599_c0_g1_i3.p1  ORF type:complete len:149 (-),score=31.62 TRINITY_DN599_c0_g1_i3:43-489(-)
MQHIQGMLHVIDLRQNVEVKKPQPATLSFVGKSSLTVYFQQNFNHWYPNNPGFMDVAIANNPETTNATDFVQFGKTVPDYNANNMATQTNFTISGFLPDIDCDHCVLRLRYASHNPDEAVPGNPEAIFYQCSDIKIVSSAKAKALGLN